MDCRTSLYIKPWKKNNFVPLWDHGFIKFQQEWNFVPWIGEEPYTGMLFWQFSNIIIYVKLIAKLPDQHLNLLLFSNLRDKVHKRWRTTGQICPALSTRIWTLSPVLQKNHTLKCWSGIFQQSWHIRLRWKIARTTFQCMVVLQSRGQHFILVEI